MEMKNQLLAQLAGFERELTAHEQEVDRLKKLIRLTKNTIRELDKIEGVEADASVSDTASV